MTRECSSSVFGTGRGGLAVYVPLSVRAALGVSSGCRAVWRVSEDGRSSTLSFFADTSEAR